MRGAVKAIDDEIVLKKPRKGARLKEEVWQTPDGRVVKYSLAYINPRICGEDNGRVLGYDNSHGHHHRHFMGATEPVEFESYETLVDRFREEVRELWRREDEQG
jgi:hypothetical protein